MIRAGQGPFDPILEPVWAWYAPAPFLGSKSVSRFCIPSSFKVVRSQPSELDHGAAGASHSMLSTPLIAAIA